MMTLRKCVWRHVIGVAALLTRVARRRVFDVTGWLDLHPAGSACLLKHAGAQDSTVDYNFHSQAARAFWAHYQIGYLEGHEPRGACIIL